MSRFPTPTRRLLTAALLIALTTPAWAQSHAHGTAAAPAAAKEMPADSPVDHGRMDHSQMDHSKMGEMDHSKMGEMSAASTAYMDAMTKMDADMDAFGITPLFADGDLERI